MLSRRMFMGTSLALGAGVLFYFNRSTDNTKFYANDMQIILHTSYHLFPVSKIGPGAIDLHISNFLADVFKDKRLLKEDKNYFLKGAFWLEESAFEEYDKSFLNLSSEEKEKLLQDVARYRWGENFIYTTLNYILEALLCSPVYGSNPDALGWKWLEHNPGFPHPQNIEDIHYEV